MHKRKALRILFPALQGRFFLLILFSAGTALVVNLGLTLTIFTRMAYQLPNDGEILREALGAELFKSALISLAIGLPAFAVLCGVASMPFFGALFRIRKFLRGVLDGTETRPCKLRDGDPLQDLCDLANEVATLHFEQAKQSEGVDRQVEVRKVA